MHSQAAIVGNTARKVRWAPEAVPSRTEVQRSFDLKVIDAFGTVILVSRDREVFAEGDSSEFCYRLVAGAVRLVKLMPDGRRQIAEFHLPRDLFGFELCDSRYLSAEAISDCTLIRYPRRRIEAIAERDHDFARYLREMASGDLRRAHERMMLLARKSAEERIASFLDDMAERSGTATTSIELAMSRVDIADYLGLTLETVSRVLNRLHRDHVITLSSATHIALPHRAALRELRGDV